MSNSSTIPCPVRCEINYRDEVFGISIKSPRTGAELYFDNLAVKAIPRCLHDRIVTGFRRGGTSSFTPAELCDLVELARKYQAAPFARKVSGSWSR